MVEDDMDFDELLEDLGINLDKSLLTIKKDDLIDMVHGMITGYKSKELVDLICEEFQIEDLLKWLEKSQPNILKQILKEPELEVELKEPVRRFIESEWKLDVDFEVPIPVGGRNRSIDVCGYEYHKKKPFLVAVELKIENKRGAIDKAFSQASDNAKGVNESYIAFSPFLFLKNFETIKQKLEDIEWVGVMIVDALNVLKVYEDPERSIYEPEIYDEVLQYMEKRVG